VTANPRQPSRITAACGSFFVSANANLKSRLYSASP
jgi:hypothetical protein